MEFRCRGFRELAFSEVRDQKVTVLRHSSFWQKNSNSKQGISVRFSNA